MEIKDLIDKIATIYSFNPSKGEDLVRKLYKATREDDGFQIVDDPNESYEEDDADRWLAENSGSAPEAEEKRKSRFSDWKAPTNLTPEQEAAVRQHMDNGYSEREAHREAGTHGEHSDFSNALRSSVRPSMMSDKRINELKGLARSWLDNADRHEKVNADIEKNPMKHASGKMLSAHEQHMGDYTKAYNDFLQSDDLKGLSPIDRHKKIREWKQTFRQNNPSHAENIANVSESQKHVSTARDTAKQTLNDKLSSIMSGGSVSPSESFSTEEGMQHAGISAGGESGPKAATGSITSDPFARFSQSNKKLVDMLSSEQKDRMKRVDSAATAQGKPPRGIVIRRKADTDAKE